eukprot:gene5792-biopygen5815
MDNDTGSLKGIVKVRGVFYLIVIFVELSFTASPLAILGFDSAAGVNAMSHGEVKKVWGCDGMQEIVATRGKGCPKAQPLHLEEPRAEAAHADDLNGLERQARSLLDDTAHKLREERCAAAAVGPYWSAQMWLQQLEAPVDEVVILPRRRDWFKSIRLGGSKLLVASSWDGAMFHISASR